MKRRHFIHAATASVLLAPVTPAAFAAGHKWDYAFFDERFEPARRLAAAWTASNGPIAVRSDVTAFWWSGLDRLARHRCLHLRGVTTDSFHFCLRILLAEHASLDLQAARLDLNLFSWTVRTTPKLLTTDPAHV